MITRALLPLSLVALLVLACSSLQPADAGRVYDSEQLTFKEVVFDEDGNVRITYHAPVETLWYCPGAMAKRTDKGLELTFVKAHFKTRPKVDYPAAALPDSISRVITVPTGGKPVLVRDGRKLVRLQAKPQVKDGEEG